MKILKPIEFQTSQLISSNAVETYAAWSSVTTYAKDAFVDYGTMIYQSLVNSNLNKQPDISPTDWIEVGPDNTHAMFDNEVSTQTVSTSPLTVTVAPGKLFSSVAFLNIENGTSLQVTMLDAPAGTTVYSRTIDLDESLVIDWYGYFFEEFDVKNEVVLDDIPPYSTSVLTFVLTGGNPVKLGNFIYGTIQDIGGTQYGATSGIKDYSVKETDQYGNTTFVQRAYSKRMEVDVMMDNGDLNYNMKLLAAIRATPCLWIATDDDKYQGALTMFGFYKDFNVTIAYPTFSMCSLSIEGLI